jgi:hypothetical protein
MNRSEFLSNLVGQPYEVNGDGTKGWDCYSLAACVQRSLFNRILPLVSIPEHPDLSWIRDTIEKHPERKRWQEKPRDRMGIVTAGDGAMVLMAGAAGRGGIRPGHVGVWLAKERRILHADKPAVMFQDLATLRLGGWRTLLFFDFVGP